MLKKMILVTAICFGLVFSMQQNCLAQSKQQDTIFTKLSPSSIALGKILQSLMPVLMFNSDNQAEIKQVVKEDSVVGEISTLIKQGVRVDSLRIINFKNAKTTDFGGFSQVTSGEFGTLVTLNDGEAGITLIEYCEEINCLIIAKIFLDEIAKINNSNLTTNKDLSGLMLKSEKGDVNSQIELGNKFLNGITPLEKDYIGAIKWYQMAADNGSAAAHYKLAEIYSRKKLVVNSNLAFQMYLKSAELGNSDAINMVGLCYMAGYGVSKDDAEAIKWWLKASEAGNSNAQASIGACYERGTGVPQDYKEALKWYIKAAEQGNVVAQGSLGVMYFNGEGVIQDYNECIKWFTKGAEQGDETCRKNLDYVKSLLIK
jgi:hypothetical protein